MPSNLPMSHAGTEATDLPLKFIRLLDFVYGVDEIR